MTKVISIEKNSIASLLACTLSEDPFRYSHDVIYVVDSVLYRRFVASCIRDQRFDPDCFFMPLPATLPSQRLCERRLYADIAGAQCVEDITSARLDVPSNVIVPHFGDSADSISYSTLCTLGRQHGSLALRKRLAQRGITVPSNTPHLAYASGLYYLSTQPNIKAMSVAI